MTGSSIQHRVEFSAGVEKVVDVPSPQSNPLDGRGTAADEESKAGPSCEEVEQPVWRRGLLQSPQHRKASTAARTRKPQTVLQSLYDVGLFKARYNRMYCSQAVKPTAVLDTIVDKACPNGMEPSDHLPVAVAFVLQGT